MTHSILITGTSRGIGLALTGKFSREGWRVFACCRDPERADALNNMVKGREGLISVHPLDVTDNKRVKELRNELMNEKIDILYNNAGVYGPEEQDFGDVNVDDWIQAFRVNTIAPLKMAEAFVKQVMRSRKKIIAIMGTSMGSIGDNTSGGFYAYRSSKSAVHMIMKNLSIDLRNMGIVCVALHPGWVRTDMGGSQALLSPSESADGLYNVLMSLTSRDNGRFLSCEGDELPW